MNSPFTVGLVKYNCAEQTMIAFKTRLFGDDTALSAILASDDPREQNRLGRQVRHFDPALWQTECEAIVLRCNLEKHLLGRRDVCCHRKAPAASPKQVYRIKCGASV